MSFKVMKIYFVPALQQEKQHESFVTGIEGFNKEKLSHADVAEKNSLPDAQGNDNLLIMF